MYKTTDKTLWSGRIDAHDAENGYRWHHVIECIDLSAKEIAKSKGVAFLGFCSDEGVKRNQGRQGAKNGPGIVRKSMANLACHLNPNVQIYDAGNVYCDDENLDEAQVELGQSVNKILETGLFPILIGGGHEIAYGHYLGISEFVKSKKLGIINFDAHFDLRPYDNGANSGTMFRQIADQCISTGEPFNYFCLGVQRYGNTVSLFKMA
ncbi:MAG: arginase family protein, partial [Bacteroidales bacterium]|nr:arginase family protein [Bacteroidales bacterium]